MDYRIHGVINACNAAGYRKDTAGIVDRHARDVCHTQDVDKQLEAERLEIEAEKQRTRERIHAWKLRKRENEQLKDALARETDREWEARS